MNQRKLYQWVRGVSKQWKGFTRHFRENVVVFTKGVAEAQSCHVRKIAGCVPGNPSSQRTRLQRFVKQRLDLSHFFSEWTRTVFKHLSTHSVVLAVDETKLKDRFGVMTIGIVVEGRCIPLAWRVYRANRKGAYPKAGQVKMILALLSAIHAGLPSNTRVRVLADRGIGTSPDLMRGIMAMGWTFLFRVTRQSKIVFTDGTDLTFYDQVNNPGDEYAASGLVFKQRGRIPGHVRVLWGQDAKDRWALVTNDPSLTGWEYAERMWIEEAFRDLKSHGWQLDEVKLDCPERVERLWIPLVVAYAWLFLWGYALEQAGGTIARMRLPNGSTRRRWSLFREGWLAFRRYTLHRKT